MAKDEKIFTLRIDSKLLEYLKTRAERNSRSIAKELEFIIKQLYIEDNEYLAELVKRIFSTYENERYQHVSLKEKIDGVIETPLRDAVVELLDFIESSNLLGKD